MREYGDTARTNKAFLVSVVRISIVFAGSYAGCTDPHSNWQKPGVPRDDGVRRGKRLGAWAMNDVLFGGIRLSWSGEAACELQAMALLEHCCAQT